MKIQKLVLGTFATNAYVVLGNVSGTCILIDPAGDPEVILDTLKDQNLCPTAVLLTHGHYDHFLAVPKLQEVYPTLPIYCNLLDCPTEKEEHDMGMVFPTVSAFSNVMGIEDKQTLKMAGLDITVYHAPGHTPGSVLFLIEDSLFTGDTLFCRSIGRTDFPGGSITQMKNSLKMIAGIEGNYNVYPGHEGVTTLDDEKKFNEYLKPFVK